MITRSPRLQARGDIRATMCTNIVKEITDFVHKSFDGKIPSSSREDFSKDLKASYQEQVCMIKLYCFEGAPDSSDSRFFLIRATKMEHLIISRHEPFYIWSDYFGSFPLTL